MIKTICSRPCECDFYEHKTDVSVKFNEKIKNSNLKAGRESTKIEFSGDFSKNNYNVVSCISLI